MVINIQNINTLYCILNRYIYKDNDIYIYSYFIVITLYYFLITYLFVVL